MVPTQRELYWKLGVGIQAVGCGSYCLMLNVDQKLTLKTGLRRHTEYGQGVQGSQVLGRCKQMAGRETMIWTSSANDTDQPPRGLWVNKRSLQLKFMPTAPILPKEMRYQILQCITNYLGSNRDKKKKIKKMNKKLDITLEQNDYNIKSRT